MTPQTPPALDRLWDEIPTGTAPVRDLLAAGRAAERRKRRSLGVGLTALTLLVVAGGAAVAAIIGDPDRSETVDHPPGTLTVTVHTALAGPEIFYFEGALTEATLTPANTPDEGRAGTDPAPVGWSHSWTSLTAGSYDLTAAVRPCGGNCDALDPPTDSCQQRIDVTAFTDVLVTYRYGQPCVITVLETRLTDLEYDVAVDLAHQEIRDQEATLTSATVLVQRGTLSQSNTGHPCESGRLLRLTLIGTFPHIVTTGPIRLPGDPALSGDDGTVHAVLITADAHTGRACLIGVKTGHVEPPAGATFLDLDQIATP